MNKIIVIWLALLVIICTVNGEKDAIKTSEEKEHSAENIKDDRESDSIDSVYKDVNKEETTVNYSTDNPYITEHYDEEHKDTNSTNDSNISENVSQDSSKSEKVILNPSHETEEITTPSDVITENSADIEVVIEDTTETYNGNENSKKKHLVVSEENNSDWRSAENSDGMVDTVETVNDEISREEHEEETLENYKDKKLSINIMDRVEPRNPERWRQHKRPHQLRRYGTPDDQSLLDPGQVMHPRLHPALTRSGFMYTPTSLSLMQRGQLLERLTGHNWIQNIPQEIPDRDIFTNQRHHRVVSSPRYEGPKMIDDYIDDGVNAYSYAPSMKTTTPVPRQPMVAPNKFDIFKKLAEASNHPRSAQRTSNDNIYPSNYYNQRRHVESLPFDLRRYRRDALDED